MKILLVDDHAMFRDGIEALLAKRQPDVATISAGSCEEAFAALQSDPEIDLVLLDLCLPDMSGLDAIPVLQKSFAKPVVALSSIDDQQTVLRSIDSGAMGFIPKTSSADTMITALQQILAKCICLPPSAFLGERQSRRCAPRSQEPSGPVKSRVTPADIGMTSRQSEALYLLFQGMPNKEIERTLDLSEGAVKAHLSSVYRILKVRNRTEAVIAAARLGIQF